MRFLKMPVAALILMLSTFPTAALEPNASCQALDAWVSQLDKLPADYDSFVALDNGQRRAVYQKLSDVERATLWQRQLRDALAQGSWNDDQRALIAETEALMTAGKLAALRRPRTGGRSESAQALLEDLGGRVAAVFSRQQARQLFYRLGPQEDMEERSGFNPPPYCECNVMANDCPFPGFGCVQAHCITYIGCGFMGLDPCDGLCRESNDPTAAPTEKI